MALTLLTGKTGSGKSYKAVETIINSLGSNRKVFTNIFINIEDPNYNYIDELEVKKLLKFIESTFKFVDNLDEKKDQLKNSIYFESDFFIDEAHLVGFREKQESILNWCTLHRHFNQNITIITQVPSNLHRDYLAMFHTHIDMIPQKRRLSKDHMGYQEFDGYKGDQYPTKHFKPNQEIFTVYGSGNKELGQSPLVKKIALLFVGLGVVLFALFYSLGSMFNRQIPSQENNNTVQEISLNTDLKKEVSKEDYNSTYEELICSTNDTCLFEGIRYSFSAISLLLSTEYNLKEKKLLLSNKKFRMYKFSYALK